MPLDLLSECEFLGPALPQPFVQFELESQLNRLGLLPRTTGDPGEALKTSWEAYRRGLRELGGASGPIRVRNHVLEPLVERLGYATIEKAEAVRTREVPEAGEAGGYFFRSADSQSGLRAWSTEFAADLDAPARRGTAYRYSHLRVAQRVLLAAGERVGLLTNGVELRILICDPARPDSQVIVPLERVWRRTRQVPDSYRLLLALCGPQGTAAIPELVDRARLMQARVTKDLRVQARQAVERFIQEVLDHPANQEALQNVEREPLARDLWREGLILVYRLLFILKMESSDDPARMFSFASTSLWRNTFSPAVALAPYARRLLDDGADTGALLEEGLRSLFRLFVEGLYCTELHVRPLGGALFGEQATPWLSHLKWGDRAVANLLDRLLWTDPRRAGETRKRVHYGPLDDEDLGRVYEALLELEPGIAEEPMCRLRRQKLEVVVPMAQGERYCQTAPADEPTAADEVGDEEREEEEEAPARGRGTRVQWIEPIRPGQFYLRVGLGRKASGSYYTPHAFVRFLVQETLGPQVAERSPSDSPSPAEILRLKVLDPAMGSGHFLVEACRFLGEKLYEAARFCDEKALEAERRATDAKSDDEHHAAEEESHQWREKLLDLPDPDGELLAYLPSRAPEGEESGLSQARARALCRRLVAVHCLYGVDKNPLAVELAKLSLWLESQAEGFPLTFLDHRLVVGDSLTGPFWDRLIYLPGSQTLLDDLYNQDLLPKFSAALQEAIRYVGYLEERVGATVAEVQRKVQMKREMDRALAPFRILAAAWAGGVMLGRERCDDTAYEELLQSVGHTGDLPDPVPTSEGLRDMLAHGLGSDPADLPLSRDALYALMAAGDYAPALAYDLTFPEVYHPTGVAWDRRGFHTVLGNPPWDQPEVSEPEYWARYDLRAIEARYQRERDAIISELRHDETRRKGWQRLQEQGAEVGRLVPVLYEHQSAEVTGQRTVGRPDVFRLFAERCIELLSTSGRAGLVVPSALHANEGATGIRRLYLNRTAMQCCFSFENKRRLFEIHLSYKFALVVTRRCDSGTEEFPCAFYLCDDEWLFSRGRAEEALSYSRRFIELTGGPHLTFVEPRNRSDYDLMKALFQAGHSSWGEVCAERGIDTAFGVELHRNRDYAVPLTPRMHLPQLWRECAESHWPRVPIVEGKSVWQFQDFWEEPVSVAPPTNIALARRHWSRSAPLFRLSFRRIAASTNERTFICTVLPAGPICDNTLAVETVPAARPNAHALLLCSLGNSYVFDYALRMRVAATVNAFIVAPVPVPRTRDIGALVVHSALRLVCNHAGYEPLWREQINTMGGSWREPKPALTWPVLATDDERWEVRAAIDAMAADAYGLSRDQYAHVLSTFSHRSYPKAPGLCLARFDELKQIGIEALARKYDPYWDIPLNENLPQPVIELPEMTAPSSPNGNGRPTNLLGEPLPLNLLGEVQCAPARRRSRRRSS